MSQAATPVTRLCAAALVAGAALIPALPAAAAPVLTSPDPAVALGIRASWVDVDSSPHTIQQALDATNGVGYTINQTINQVLSFIDHGDGSNGEAVIDPLSDLGDDSFAVRYTGYLRILDRGSYRFGMFHDDGIRVTLGGEVILEVDSDTSPTLTQSDTFDLLPGYYTLDIIGWEQGGQFVNRFGLINANGGLDVTENLYHAGNGTVPLPGTLALAGLGLLGLSLRRRG